ncbi:hypothetical protein Tco_0522870 [Tanacetum coccineum]
MINVFVMTLYALSTIAVYDVRHWIRLVMWDRIQTWYLILSLFEEPPGSLPCNCNVLPTLVHQSLHPCLLASQIALLEVKHLSQLVYTATSFPCDTVVSTFLFLVFEEVLRLLLVGSLSSSEADSDGGGLFAAYRTGGESSVAGTAGVVTIVGV